MKRMPVAFTSALLVIVIVISLAGCAEDPRVGNLQREITSAKNEIASLKEEVAELKRQREFEQLFKDFDKIAYLTPGSEGYSTIRFDLGVLTISIGNVVEYANGSKVTLQFGNPLSSTINGLQAKIEYGEVDEKGMPQNGTTKTKEVTFSKSLRSGSWTKVSVVLDGIPSSKLGFVRVREVSHTGISLTKQ